MYCSIVKIAKVRKSDEGTYEVVAKNREGEATNTLVLNVTDRKGSADRKDAPPVVVKPLTPTMCKVRTKWASVVGIGVEERQKTSPNTSSDPNQAVEL